MTSPVRSLHEIEAVWQTVLENWDRLEPLVRAAKADVSLLNLDLTSDELETLKTWGSLFKEEIEDVRRARNLVVHAPAAISLMDAVEANEYAVRLLDILKTRLPKVEELLNRP